MVGKKKLSFPSPLTLLVIVQGAFVILGIQFLEFNISWIEVGIALGSAAIAELLLSRLTGKPILFPTSAMAAGLGIALFFRASSPWFFALCSILAVASKYVFKKPNGHIFNPSNFGIVTLVFLFPAQTTIEFTQWGGSYFVFIPFALAALFVAYRAGVLHTTLSFFAAYAFFFFTLAPLVFNTYSAHHYGLLSTTLILFASFMITDPRSAPQGFREGIVHGATIAGLFFALEAFGFRYAIFLASFLVSLLNIVSRAIVKKLCTLIPGEVPQNLPSSAFVILVLAVGVVHAYSGGVGVNPMRISPDFLLRGVESSKILSCKEDPVFDPSEVVFTDAGSAFGAAWGDYNNDGFDDLFIASRDKPSTLYKNNGDGTFENVTELLGSEVRATSGIFADYDNDGRVELFIALSSTIHPTKQGLPGALERLAEGMHVTGMKVLRFTDYSAHEITRELGLKDVEFPKGHNVAMSFADYDRDGSLDFVYAASGSLLSPEDFGLIARQKSFADPLFPQTFTIACEKNEVAEYLSRYLKTKGVEAGDFVDMFAEKGGCLFISTALPLISSDARAAELLPPPGRTLEVQLFVPGDVKLFVSRGEVFLERKNFSASIGGTEGPTVRKVEGAHPYERTSRLYYQPVSFDYDKDGLQDIYLATDFGRNTLLRNKDGLLFEDVTENAELDHAAQGMGVALGDIDRNGWIDILFTNFLEDYLFFNQDDGTFKKSESTLAPIGIGWGVSFLDYDMDGTEDIFITNGDVRRTQDVPVRALGRSLFRLDTLYRGEGEGEFSETTWDDLCPSPRSGKSLAVSDYDNNGTPDVFVGSLPLSGSEVGESILYKNASADKSFVKIKLSGTISNSQGIGAVVSVTTGSTTQRKVLTAGESFNSQHSSALLFALGDAEDADITVEWPSGRTSRMSDVSGSMTVYERDATFSR